MAALVAALTLSLAGCSGDEDPSTGDEQRSDSEAVDTLATTAEIGVVTGRLDRQQRRRVVDQVAGVVDGWLDAAYVAGDYPRDRFGDAYPGFTGDAARLAARRQAVTSNAAIGERVESVTATRRLVRVDVLAPQGRPAGATARVVLVMRLDGDLERTDRVQGRLLLSPTERGWQVFGFDLQRGAVR